MGFKWIITQYVLREKNEFKSIVRPILSSERNMGIDYIDNVLGHKIHYNQFFSLLLNAGSQKVTVKFLLYW